MAALSLSQKSGHYSIFYRANAIGDDYFAARRPEEGLLTPRFGLTDGWFPVEGGPRLVKAGHHEVTLANTKGEVWYHRDGTPLNTSDAANSAITVDARSSAALLPLLVGKSEPLGLPQIQSRRQRRKVTFIVFRWAEAGSASSDVPWGPTECSVSDGYISGFFDSVHADEGLCLAYQVVTVFVTCTADLSRVDAHTLATCFSEDDAGDDATGRAQQPESRVALYFLWPSNDPSPTAPGYVNRADLFGCMKRLEMAGVATRFPHPAGLYETLVSKSWQTTCCVPFAPQFCVPTCVRVERSSVEAATGRSSVEAATGATAAARAALDTVKRLEASAGVGLADADCTGFIVKLGFSWEALHVCAVSDSHQLAAAMRQLTLSSASAVCADSFLVQRKVRCDFELRVFVVRGRTVAKRLTRYAKVGDGYVQSKVPPQPPPQTASLPPHRPSPHESTTVAFSKTSNISLELPLLISAWAETSQQWWRPSARPKSSSGDGRAGSRLRAAVAAAAALQLLSIARGAPCPSSEWTFCVAVLAPPAKLTSGLAS
jgi:hypothetical protein